MDIERVGSRGLRLFYGEGNLSQEVLLPDYSNVPVLSKADQYACALIVVAICLVGFVIISFILLLMMVITLYNQRVREK